MRNDERFPGVCAARAWSKRRRAAVRAALGAVLPMALATGLDLDVARALPQASPPTVDAQPGRVTLHYQLGKGSAGCEDEATFRRWVTGKMHVDPFLPSGPSTHLLSLAIEREAPGFRFIAELRDAAGHVVVARDALERTCADAVDRLVAIVLISVFPPPRQAPPPQPAPACVPCDEPLRNERAARSAADDDLRTELQALQNELQALKRKGYGRAMDLTFALSAGALLTANLTSNVGPGIWLAGEARSGPLALGLELRSVLPSRVVVGPYDFDLSQLAALLTPCGRYSYFFGCGIAGAGVQLNTDSDYPSPDAATGFFPLLQFGGRLGVEVPIGESPFAVRGWGEVLYSTPHTSFEYVDTGYSADRPDVSAFFGVGFVVKIGEQGAR